MWEDVKNCPNLCLDFGDWRRRVELPRKSTTSFPLLLLLLWSKNQVMSFQEVEQHFKNNSSILILKLKTEYYFWLIHWLHRKREGSLLGLEELSHSVWVLGWIMAGNPGCSLHWFAYCKEKKNVYMKLL